MVTPTKGIPFKWDPLGHSLIFSLQNQIVNKTNLPLAHHLHFSSLKSCPKAALYKTHRWQHFFKEGR
jgi:hypothetical protein